MTFRNFHMSLILFSVNSAVVYWHCTNSFEHHTIATFFARWRHSATKLLNKKVITAFSIQYCRSSPTSMQFGRGVFKIFAMKHAGPVFWGHPVYSSWQVVGDATITRCIYTIRPGLARKYRWYISMIYIMIESWYFQAKISWYFYIFDIFKISTFIIISYLLFWLMHI